MPKVLFVANIGRFFSDFLIPHAQYLRRQGWQVDGAAADMAGCFHRDEIFDRTFDLGGSRNPFDIPNLVSDIRRIRAIVEQEGYDIVHVHTPIPAFVTRLALNPIRRKGKPKVIYTAHGFHFHKGGNPIKNNVFLGIEKLAGAWSDYLVVINKEDEGAALRYNIVPSKHLRYMPGIGLDLGYYSSQSASEAEVRKLRAEFGLSQNQPLFLMVAEFTPGKRHRDALKAFALISPQAHLALAGIGPMEGEIKQLATELGIAERVHFLGWRRDIPALIRTSSATLLPSEREGLPRAIMESLALETPAISTRIRGVQELLEDGCGLMVEVGDVQGLADGMTWVIHHPEEAKAMGKRGRLRVNNYDLQHILRLHSVLYAEALGDHSDGDSGKLQLGSIEAH